MPPLTRTASTTAIGAALALCTALLSGCSTGTDKDLLAQIESGTVQVGSAFTNPGLSVREGENVSGLDVDVATYVINSIADDNGWAHPIIEWRTTPAGQRAQLLSNDYADMVASTYSITKDRAGEVSFGGPYLLTHQAMLLPAGTLDTSPDGKNLCFVTGTTAAEPIRAQFPQVQLSEYDSYTACLDALHVGSVDGVTTDAAILSGFAAQSPGAFDVVTLDVNGVPLTDEHYGLGLRRGDDQGVAAVNKALERMYDDGSFDKFVRDNLADNAVVERDTPGDMSFL